jgi:hypothetical protein
MILEQMMTGTVVGSNVGTCWQTGPTAGPRVRRQLRKLVLLNEFQTGTRPAAETKILAIKHRRVGR